MFGTTCGLKGLFVLSFFSMFLKCRGHWGRTGAFKAQTDNIWSVKGSKEFGAKGDTWSYGEDLPWSH